MDSQHLGLLLEPHPVPATADLPLKPKLEYDFGRV
jgi:hypothetical protein